MGRPKVTKVKVNCFVCGKEAEKYLAQVQKNKTGRFFCSAKCRRTVGIKPRTAPRHQCERCGKEFPVYGKQPGRFCSKTCYDAWQGRNRVERICEGCGKEFSFSPSQAQYVTGRWCSRECWTLAAPRRPAGHMHNGRPAVIDSSGYVRVYEPTHPAAYKNGQVLEHRVVMEATLGRRLTTAEHVHHINGNKTDNRPENLVVLSHSEHSRHEGNGRWGALKRMQDELAEYRKRYGDLE